MRHMQKHLSRPEQCQPPRQAHQRTSSRSQFSASDKPHPTGERSADSLKVTTPPARAHAPSLSAHVCTSITT